MIRKILIPIVIFLIVLVVLILPKKQDITLQQAHENYISNIMHPFATFPPHPCDTEMFFECNNCLVEKTKNYLCYSLDVKDNENIKLKVYVINHPEISQRTVFQTVFDYTNVLDTDIVFSVGDSVNDIKAIYPDVQIIKTNYAPEYIEIINKSGFYNYCLDESGMITSATFVDLDDFAKLFIIL